MAPGSIVLRRDKLFAVCCEQSLRDSVDRWLKGSPAPLFRLVSKNLIQAAFVRGEAKGLWLHGMHPRSAFRPRSKQLSGLRLEDSLSPLEDSSFAMSAARSKLPEDLALTSLSGTVGTSPRKGTVWNRQAEDFTDFMNTAIEMMELVEEAVTSDHLLLSRLWVPEILSPHATWACYRRRRNTVSTWNKPAARIVFPGPAPARTARSRAVPDRGADTPSAAGRGRRASAAGSGAR